MRYAAQLKGKKKAELKKAISQLCKPTKVLEYGSGSGKTWSGFYKTDRDETTNECINRYSLKVFEFSSSTSSISGMNIEHSFPKSWWGGAENMAYKDLFNLYPSDTEANTKKSNYPMGKVTNPKLLNDFEKVGTGPAGSLGNITLCEPNDIWKGDFCRSYFYMATVYQDLNWQGTQGLQTLENNEWPTLKEWAYKLYLEWTRKDKVLEIEVKRNNAIYSIQGNRNLFIDFPYLAEYVWGDSINVPFDPTTSLSTASDDNRYLTGTESDDESEDGDYLFAETFSTCEGTGGNDNSWNGSIANSSIGADNVDESDWSFTKGFCGKECAKIGIGSEAGSATTRSLSELNGYSFTIYFDAAAWDSSSEKTTLNISATNCSLSSEKVELKKGEWTTYSIEVTDVSGPVSFTFSGSGKYNRIFLDNVIIPKDEVRKSVAGDLNGDGIVTIVDLAILIQRFKEGGDVSADGINAITNLILNK